MRLNRLGVLAAVILAGVAVPAQAQTYRDRWMDQQDAKIRAELNQLQAQRRTTRVQPLRVEQQERMHYDMQDRMREQSIRVREQQERLHEQQIERARAQHEREIERAQELRERTFERAAEQRERELERAQAARERAQEQRERLLEAQINRDANRRVYITPPPSVKFRNRWP